MTQNPNSQRKTLEEIRAGMSLAEPVLGAHGEVVLPQGVTLTDALLQSLGRRGIESLSVLAPKAEGDDPATNTKDIAVQMARIGRLFRHATEYDGTDYLRTLVTQYRMAGKP